MAEKTQTTQLSETKLAQLNAQPVIESAVTKSEDGKWILSKVIITSIKPTSYFEKVMAGRKE